MVHLGRQAGARLHRDALDLVARPMAHRAVRSPGALHLAVGVQVRPVLGLEDLDQALDVLRPVFMGHQHGVGRFDHHDVVQAHRSDQPAGGVDQAVAGILDHDVACGGVALHRLLGDAPDRVPGPYVAP
ncbi:hypothetical protein G6F68_015982 [Rhizopus microsporus]|nr:hypothetical protein G6F68_015982 [Rhizopus microsporus]